VPLGGKRDQPPAERLREQVGGDLAAEEPGREVPEGPLPALRLVDGQRGGAVEAQLDQAVEEAAELIQAINKFKRYNSPWPLIEEMVDVEIMIGQLKAIVRDATGRSNNRMYNRIREEKLKKVEEKLK